MPKQPMYDNSDKSPKTKLFVNKYLTKTEYIEQKRLKREKEALLKQRAAEIDADQRRPTPVVPVDQVPEPKKRGRKKKSE